MKEKRNLHLKVQELCDCYATTDPLKEMSEVKHDSDIHEAALKWIALAALHGINDNADKISIARSKDGQVKVTATYRKSELPSPGSNVGRNIIQAVREITHLEGNKGKIQLSLGIRESSIDLTIKIKAKEDTERVTIKFPE
jgi:hypothetical protein